MAEMDRHQLALAYDAVEHKPSSPYVLQHFSIFAKLIIADFEKTPGKGVTKVRRRALCPYTITACLRDTME